MGSHQPEHYHPRCESCGLPTFDMSTDFGLDPSVVMRPTCVGIEVLVSRRLAGVISRHELRDFLERAYGPVEDWRVQS